MHMTVVIDDAAVFGFDAQGAVQIGQVKKAQLPLLAGRQHLTALGVDGLNA